MNGQNRKTHELDRIGNAILAADRLRDYEVEAIANAPYTLSAVKARIAAEPQGRPGNGMQAVNFTKLFRTRVAWASATMVMAVVGLFAAVLVRLDKKPIAIVEAPKAAEQKFAELPQSEPKVFTVPAVVSPVAEHRQPKVERAVLKMKPRKPAELSPRRMPEEKPLEFYALASVQDPAGALGDGRIIRVELPKASLLSLGVNVPLESGSSVVKTDLLVGADGIAKAIRLVE